MRAWGIITVLAIVAIASGCGRRRYDPLYNPRRLARYEDRLMRVAARDSGCSPMQVAVGRVAETVWVANTCTGPREYFLRCGRRGRRCSWDRIATVNESAAPVLGCPPQAIAQQVTASPTTRFASGCGRQVQMSMRCNQIACGWMPDGPPRGPSPAYGAPPPVAAPRGAPPVIYVPAPQR